MSLEVVLVDCHVIAIGTRIRRLFLMGLHVIFQEDTMGCVIFAFFTGERCFFKVLTKSSLLSSEFTLRARVWLHSFIFHHVLFHLPHNLSLKTNIIWFQTGFCFT